MAEPLASSSILLSSTPAVRKVHLYRGTWYFPNHRPAVGFAPHLAMGQISLPTQGFWREADMDKLLVMPNPECKKPLACTLAKMRAEPQGMAALVGRGLQGRNLLSQGTLHNPWVWERGQRGVPGAKPYQMLARLSCLATEWRHLQLAPGQSLLLPVVHCGSSGSEQ